LEEAEADGGILSAENYRGDYWAGKMLIINMVIINKKMSF